MLHREVGRFRTSLANHFNEMKKDIDYVIVQGETCDIDSIVQFQADMAMESEGISEPRNARKPLPYVRRKSKTLEYPTFNVYKQIQVTDIREEQLRQTILPLLIISHIFCNFIRKIMGLFEEYKNHPDKAVRERAV